MASPGWRGCGAGMARRAALLLVWVASTSAAVSMPPAPVLVNPAPARPVSAICPSNLPSCLESVVAPRNFLCIRFANNNNITVNALKQYNPGLDCTARIQGGCTLCVAAVLPPPSPPLAPPPLSPPSPRVPRSPRAPRKASPPPPAPPLPPSPHPRPPPPSPRQQPKPPSPKPPSPLPPPPRASPRPSPSSVAKTTPAERGYTSSPRAASLPPPPPPPAITPAGIVLEGNNDPSNPASWWYLDANVALARHNFYRIKHQAQPLAWSARLQKEAQDWADNCWFVHSSRPYGENLALGHPSITAAMDAWYAEEKVYDYANPQFNAGHFTQMVWQRTYLVGCAIGVCPDGVSYVGGVWVGRLYVCMYWPPGNYMGQFSENVYPPEDGSRRRQALGSGEL
ncbi:hypothetical protein HYH02_008614 [Chlamydomonas schloesseri]|uniref:SCP domain-containing protein n=1 Tax=Chlamydomonas schloesseri TaxID=2026947 RepID=A0A836B1T7_9CHLO|nr:hypothetical protein HYH02_008614 [Chlamydomonas schloesseri]|eukprot:KAG2445146.1 hypothetical protein HYH02_008614 [Chlamydomonas schloesseri]